MAHPIENPIDAASASLSDPSIARGEHIPFSPTQADVSEFQFIMRGECGVALDNAEAWNRMTELVTLFRMLMAPIPEDPQLE